MRAFSIGLYLAVILAFLCIAAGAADHGGGAIVGRVSHGETGLPISGALVTARHQESNFEAAAIAAEDGAFILTLLPPGLYTIAVEGGEDVLSSYRVGMAGTGSQPLQIRLPAGGAAETQRTGPSRQPQSLELQSPAPGRQVMEASIRWDSEMETARISRALSDARSQASGLTLLEVRQARGNAPRQRLPEISETQILMIISDEQEQQKDWMLIPDPRIIRAEFPGPGGELSGQIFYLSPADFLVPVSTDLLPAKLKFYKPRWTGQAFSFDLVGTVSLH